MVIRTKKNVKELAEKNKDGDGLWEGMDKYFSGGVNPRTGQIKQSCRGYVLPAVSRRVAQPRQAKLLSLDRPSYVTPTVKSAM